GTVGTVMDRPVGVHGACQQLGAAEIDADDASLGHAGHLTVRTSPWPTRTTTAPTPRTRPARGSSRAATTTAWTRARTIARSTRSTVAGGASTRAAGSAARAGRAGEIP